MSQASHLTRISLSGSAAATALLFGAAPALQASTTLPDSPEYQPPSLEDVSEDTIGTARVADGEGSQVSPGAERTIQIESPAHFLNTPYEAEDELDVWIVPPEGEDGTYFGTFSVPDDDTDGHYFTFLGPLTFPESAFDYSGVYAAVLTDSSGEILVWQRTMVEREGEELDHDAGPGTDGVWPVPEGVDDEEAPPPELSDLTEDTYGALAIDEDAPVLPLNRSFSSITESSESPTRYWLIPPDGDEAITVNSRGEPSDPEVSLATMRIDDDQIPFTGIYALAGTDTQNNVVAWSPFGVSPEGRSIAAGDPGVNADNTATDRSIFPIPDSVPVPDEEDDENEEPSPTGTAPAESDEAAPSPDASPSPDEDQIGPETEGAEASGDVLGLSVPAAMGVGIAGLVVVAAIIAGGMALRRRNTPGAP